MPKRLILLRGGPGDGQYVEVDVRASAVTIPAAVEFTRRRCLFLKWVPVRYDIDWEEQVGSYQGEQEW